MRTLWITAVLCHAWCSSASVGWLDESVSASSKPTRALRSAEPPTDYTITASNDGTETVTITAIISHSTGTSAMRYPVTLATNTTHIVKTSQSVSTSVSFNATSSTLVVSNTLSTNTTIFTTSPSHTTETTDPEQYEQPGNCLPGTQCAWKIAIGLTFGTTIGVVAFWVVSRKYRMFLYESQRQHHQYWNNRERWRSEEHTDGVEGLSMAFLDTPPPDYGTQNQRPLSSDVQSIVDRVEMQVQSLRLPVDRYGSVTRKPLPYS